MIGLRTNHASMGGFNTSKTFVRVSPGMRGALRIRAKRCNTSVNGLLRRLLFAPRRLRLSPRRLSRETYLELGRIGSDLNQIVRSACATQSALQSEAFEAEIENLRDLVVLVQSQILP